MRLRFRGGRREECSGLLTGLRIRKAYLRGLAVRQDAVPPEPRSWWEREGEGDRDREDVGREVQRGEEGKLLHAVADTARISQQRCPNTAVPEPWTNSPGWERHVRNEFRKSLLWQVIRFEGQFFVGWIGGDVKFNLNIFAFLIFALKFITIVKFFRLLHVTRDYWRISWWSICVMANNLGW